MQNLLAFISKYYYWLLFIVLEAISITLFFSYNSYQSSVWFSSANVVVGKCYDVESEITSYFGLKNANKVLTEKNAQLELELIQLRQKLLKAGYDSATVRKELPEYYKVINAVVVQNSVNKRDNLITIDKGTADGVYKDMGVISGSGVVGIVYLAGTHYSVVIPVLNAQSNISCTIRNRGYFGYLHWSGWDSQYAYLEDVPRHAHFRNGDIVETSGYSSVFPKGIAVGKVICTFNSSDGLSYRVKVKLSTDFSCLRDVAVVDNSLMQEQLEILRAAKDSIASRQ